MNNHLGRQIIRTIGDIEDVHIWPMPVNYDRRGRLFKASDIESSAVLPIHFDTHEHYFTESRAYVFRGMHFQGYPHSVSKIISIVQGAALDFLFDMRTESATFGRLQVINLNESAPLSFFIPVGVAHGYLALVEKTIISYRMNGQFCANCDGGFSGDLVNDLLPIPFRKTTLSARDIALEPFEKFKYRSKCWPESMVNS